MIGGTNGGEGGDVAQLSIQKRPVNEKAVDMLEGLLARAKEGEITEICVAYLMATDKGPGHGSAYSSGSDGLAMFGAVSDLFHSFWEKEIK